MPVKDMMRLILLTTSPAPRGPDAWPHRFDEVVCGDLDAIAQRYAVVLPAPQSGPMPVFDADNRIALLCHEFESLRRIIDQAPACDIVFQPSALALLDQHRLKRSTLIAARALAAGEVLVSADLSSEIGGRGASAELMEILLDRRVLYDVEAGGPIDFGNVEEDEVERR